MLWLGEQDKPLKGFFSLPQDKIQSLLWPTGLYTLFPANLILLSI